MWIDDVNALFIADIIREQLVDGLVAKFTIWVRVLEITRICRRHVVDTLLDIQWIKANVTLLYYREERFRNMLDRFREHREIVFKNGYAIFEEALRERARVSGA